MLERENFGSVKSLVLAVIETGDSAEIKSCIATLKKSIAERASQASQEKPLEVRVSASFSEEVRSFLALQLSDPIRQPGVSSLKALSVSEHTLDQVMDLFLADFSRHLNLGEKGFKLMREHFVWIALLEAREPVSVEKLALTTGYSLGSLTDSFIKNINLYYLANTERKILGSVAAGFWV